jgi:hypothetical protein
MADFSDDPRLAELLALLHLGFLPHRVGARISQIVRDNPPDALERLERAANYLNLTGEHADELVARDIDNGPEPARDYLAPPK